MRTPNTRLPPLPSPFYFHIKATLLPNRRGKNRIGNIHHVLSSHRTVSVTFGALCLINWARATEDVEECGGQWGCNRQNTSSSMPREAKRWMVLGVLQAMLKCGRWPRCSVRTDKHPDSSHWGAASCEQPAWILSWEGSRRQCYASLLRSETGSIPHLSLTPRISPT